MVRLLLEHALVHHHELSLLEVVLQERNTQTVPESEVVLAVYREAAQTHHLLSHHIAIEVGPRDLLSFCEAVYPLAGAFPVAAAQLEVPAVLL